MLLQSRKQKSKKQQQQQSLPSASVSRLHTRASPGSEETTAEDGGNEIAGDTAGDTVGSAIKRSQSILSPHLSVFQALQNPDLELDLSTLNQRVPPLSSDQSFHNNNDFSITSWQSVPSFTAMADSKTRLSSTARLNNINSPNVGSILSSSDNDERERNLDDLNGQTSNHRVIVFDSESASDTDDDDDEDDDITVDSSTIVPSFVMPRVSIPSLTEATSNTIRTVGSIGLTDRTDSLRIQVIGFNKDILLSRLRAYRKTLGNIQFTDQNPDLIILIVNANNYLVPNLVNKPYLAIFVGSLKTNSVDESVFERPLLRKQMLCEPIRLKSIHDDIMPVIELLTNLEASSFPLDEVLATSRSHSTKAPVLNKVNSILIENSAEKLRRSSRSSRRASDSSDNGKAPNNTRQRLILGITVGMMSLTLVLLWKEFVSAASDDSVPLDAQRLKNVVVAPQQVLKSECSGGRTGSDLLLYSASKASASLVSLYECALKGSLELLEVLKSDLESFSKLLSSSSFFFIERTKLTFLHLLDVGGELFSK